MRLRMTPRRRRPVGRAERGAALVEFAMVALLLITIVAGTWDYGRGWRAGLAATEAARTGARVGSGVGNDVQADFQILTGMRANLASSGQLDNVERVVIFRVTNANATGVVPAACKTALAVGGCHIIPGNAFRAMSTTWNAGNYTSAGCMQAVTGRGWCPTARNAVQLTADTLGVYVRLIQDNDFPLLGETLTIERTAAMRIEPEESS